MCNKRIFVRKTVVGEWSHFATLNVLWVKFDPQWKNLILAAINIQIIIIMLIIL